MCAVMGWGGFVERHWRILFAGLPPSITPPPPAPLAVGPLPPSITPPAPAPLTGLPSIPAIPGLAPPAFTPKPDVSRAQIPSNVIVPPDQRGIVIEVEYPGQPSAWFFFNVDDDTLVQLPLKGGPQSTTSGGLGVGNQVPSPYDPYAGITYMTAPRTYNLPGPVAGAYPLQPVAPPAKQYLHPAPATPAVTQPSYSFNLNPPVYTAPPYSPPIQHAPSPMPYNPVATLLPYKSHPAPATATYGNQVPVIPFVGYNEWLAPAAPAIPHTNVPIGPGFTYGAPHVNPPAPAMHPYPARLPSMYLPAIVTQPPKPFVPEFIYKNGNLIKVSAGYPMPQAVRGYQSVPMPPSITPPPPAPVSSPGGPSAVPSSPAVPSTVTLAPAPLSPGSPSIVPPAPAGHSTVPLAPAPLSPGTPSVISEPGPPATTMEVVYPTWTPMPATPTVGGPNGRMTTPVRPNPTTNIGIPTRPSATTNPTNPNGGNPPSIRPEAPAPNGYFDRHTARPNPPAIRPMPPSGSVDPRTPRPNPPSVRPMPPARNGYTQQQTPAPFPPSVRPMPPAQNGYTQQQTPGPMPFPPAVRPMRPSGGPSVGPSNGGSSSSGRYVTKPPNGYSWEMQENMRRFRWQGQR